MDDFINDFIIFIDPIDFLNFIRDFINDFIHDFISVIVFIKFIDFRYRPFPFFLVVFNYWRYALFV